MKNRLGQRGGDTSEVVFEDLRVPKRALRGEEGVGFKIAMQTFDRSRPEIGAICIGVSQRALDESLRYAKERQQFGQAIAQFQAVQFILADMAVEVEAMRLLIYKAAWLIDQGATAPIVSAYAKAFGADHAMKINAVQIRRLRVHEGVPGREAHARREAPPDLRGHEPDPASREARNLLKG
jgi:acyl-CoA dehydrogenase